MRANMKTIASLAGVSVSTVSKIMNNYTDVSEETKTRVLAIMKQTGYIPVYSARALASRKSGLIGVIFAGEVNVDFTHPFFVEVINSFKKQIGVLGYDLLFFSNEKIPTAGDYLSRCLASQVEGCIIISGDQVEPSIQDLDHSPIPCIGVDLELNGPGSGYIMSDNMKIAAKAVEHFYVLGYKELGYIGSSPDSEISNIRKQGYMNAMEAFGLQINPDWFVSGETFFELSGYQAMQKWIRTGDLPRAVFASSDLIALGAMRALKEHRLSIPQDIAIIGCDDIEASRYVDPPLTTIRQNKDKLGKLAAHMLYDMINNQSAISSFVLEPELIVRESCGCSLAL
ncbi:LacI family DNA-binding transcriptional regulator [Paenibacillus filicis]|uniref:LacI family DNA-binding transcriptional regulator n=1 Tax=Paenibacillus filicis TaxID=669464 RepID=A0ABU9DKK9_9BACL